VTGPAVLNMLLGAALVAIGVLAAALADRIRGLRISRERAATAPREQTPRVGSVAPARATIEIIEAEPVSAAKSGRAPAPRVESKAEPKAQAMTVVDALVAAGYKRSFAIQAVQGCGVTERATIEDWTRAALRRCARGGLS
jgi:hypothetical protein